MHASSLENMRICYRRYVENSLASESKIIVIDIGGADVNGSYREIFNNERFLYLAADLEAHEGVSIVLSDPYKLPFDDSSIDIVLSGQMLEHCEFFWLSFVEMVRVLKPGGYIFLIAPSAGPIHRYPVDCYRFYPDAFVALAKYANCRLVDMWLDERGPWNDLIGVFSRHSILQNGTAQRLRVAPLSEDLPVGCAEEELQAGDVSYLAILETLHRDLNPSLYLEIGVRHGRSLVLARCSAVGIDPAPDLNVELPQSAVVIAKPSDDFFAEEAKRILTSRPELVFIDGLHLFEQALRDFMHVERLAHPSALVVFDDIFPNNPAQAARRRSTRVWTGDIWKIYPCLRNWRPDLFLLPLNVAPAGLLLVAGLDTKNDVLWKNYNPIVRANIEDADPPPNTLRRVGAEPGNSLLVSQIACKLRAFREGQESSDRIGSQLLAMLQGFAS